MKHEVNRLCAAFQSGDDQAFADLVNLLQKPLYSFTFKHLGRVEEAVDIVQETLIRLHQKLNTDSSEDQNLFSWCFTVAHNLCLDHLRKQNRLLPESSLPELSHMPDPEEQLRIREIQSCLNLLPEDAKHIIILAMQEELSQADIAAILDIPVGTVKSKLFYARKRLKAILREKGYETGT